MNLLHFLPSAFFGGPEKQILQSAITLRARHGHDSKFFVMLRKGQSPSENGFLEKLRQQHFVYSLLETRIHYDFFSSRVLLKRAIKELTPDVLLSYGYKANILSATLGKGLPRVAVLHGWTASDLKVQFFEWLERALLGRFDSVVVISRAQQRQLQEQGVHDVRCIPNAFEVSGLPAPLATDAIRSRLGLASNGILVGTVGRLSTEKGHRYLIEAFVPISTNEPQAYLILVGEGPLEAALRAQAHELGIADRVKFAGFQPEGGRWIGGLDLFVLPSLREAFPIVMLEAFAYRTPMVGTRVGDVPELVQDGRTGWLVAPGDAAALTAAIRDALASPEKCRAQADRAHALLLDSYQTSSQGVLWNELLARLR